MENNNVRKLWGQEFDIVEKGLDEAQVVAFVDDLLSQHKVASQQQKNLAHLRMLADTAIIEANKMAASIMAQATKEAEAEAARIVAKAEQRAQEIVGQEGNAAKIEEEAKEGQVATLETGTDLDRTRDEVIEALSQSEEGTATEIQKDEQATAIPDKQIETTEEPSNHYTPVQETPSEAEPVSAPGKKEGPTLYEGQIEIVIEPPADFARLRELEEFLRDFPQVKTVLEGGSWDRGNTLIVSLEEPIALVDALRSMPDVGEVKVLSQHSKHSQGKTILISPKNEQAQPQTEGLAATQPQNEESRQNPAAESHSQPLSKPQNKESRQNPAAESRSQPLSKPQNEESRQNPAAESHSQPLSKPQNEESRQNPAAESRSQPLSNGQSLTHPEQAELIASTLDSGHVLKLWTILSALPEVNIMSMDSLKDTSGTVFKLDVTAGFPLVEHLKAMIPGIVLVKDSNRIQAQLP